MHNFNQNQIIMKKKVNIIGAGIAGLCAGSYLQMNGYETEIFELHNIAGGLCTSWERKGYTIDGCIHWLVGSSPSDKFYFLWNELLDMQKMKFVDHEIYFRTEDKNGNFINVYTDVDKLEQEFLSKAPEDRELILELTAAVRKFSRWELPIEKPQELMNLFDGIKMVFKVLPFMKDVQKWIKISATEYAKRYRNPLLSKTIEWLFVPEMSFLFQLFSLAWFTKKAAGYPIGGSLNFAQLLEKKYTELGGKINYRAKVKKIITEGTTANSVAKGIQLENGQTHFSDYTISAADGHHTIFELLEGKFVDKKISYYYDNFKTFSSLLYVSIGVNRKFDNEPSHVVIPLVQALLIDPQTTTDSIGYRIFNFDPTMASEGKTVISLMIETYNYQYWVDLKKNNLHKYKAEKERIANEIIEALDKRLGNIKTNVEMVDVATPSTFIRYTNNWKGSFEGWILTPQIGLQQLKKTIAGLHNFYQIGQWVEPGGGLPTCIMSGRNVAQLICKNDKVKFSTTHY